MGTRAASELVGTFGLTLAAAAGLVLAIVRRPATTSGELRWTSLLFVAGILCQIAHFSEEYATRFYERFPAALGLEPWTSDFFLVFNLCWLAIWVWAAVALRSGSRTAFFPAWFFALAAAANGVAHPLLALRAGGYFPGLITSPVVGIVGVWLLKRLAAITERQPSDLSLRDVGLFFETIAFSVVVPGAVTYWIPRDVLDLWPESIPSPESIRHFISVVPLALGLA